ncbi:MAG: flagellar biosynthesis protein [Holophaga sp.]|nr:flagellar biosynthesis protein [Holophaga sp.]
MKAFGSLWFALGLLVIGGTGCAVNRSVVAVPTKQVADPAQGPVVVITRVADLRTFELAPDDPSVPSLKDGAITDKAITSRAFGRKRNGYGMAMGDVLLPEGNKVEALVKAGLTAALREAGFRVKEVGSEAPGDALTLDVEIKRLWCWFVPGFWYITTNFKATLDLKGTVLKGGIPQTVEVKTDKGHQVVTDDDWAKTLETGVEALSGKVKESLKTP